MKKYYAFTLLGCLFALGFLFTIHGTDIAHADTIAASSTISSTSTTPTNLPIDVISYGNTTAVDFNGLTCGQSPEGCTVHAYGNAFATDIGSGTFSSTFLSTWLGNSTPNGKGGYCTPTNGTGSFSSGNSSGDTISLSVSGTTCDQTVTNPMGTHVFKGQFTVSGGSGKFRGITGSGNLTTIDNGNGNGWYVMTALVILPFSSSSTSTATSTPTSTPSYPNISLTPTSLTVDPGQHVDFNGRNFAHEENVVISRNGSTIGTTHADGGGNFSTGSLTTPYSPGTYIYSFLGSISDTTLSSLVTVR